MISFPHEQELLERIDNLYSRSRINPSANISPNDVKEIIGKLVESTKQRLRVADAYLGMIHNLNGAPYLTRLYSSPPDSGQPITDPLVCCSNTDYQITIVPENNDAFCSFMCLVVDGFFSNVIGASDSFAKIVNILYNCVNSMNYIYLHRVRVELVSSHPQARLTRLINTFHPDSNGGVGSRFNTAKSIRNELTHDILDVLDFPPPYAMYGRMLDSNPRFHFKERFFQLLNTSQEDRELTTFCSDIHQDIVLFIDQSYQLMRNKLRTTGRIPV